MSSQPMSHVLPTSRSGSTESLVSAHVLDVVALLEKLSHSAIAAIVEVLDTARLRGRTIFTLGNGGSAATAMHLCNDLAAIVMASRPRIRAVCLSCNISLLSALANDLGYEHVFTQQLAGLMQPEDVVIGISASGNSPNCVTALAYARERGATTIGLLGFDGGAMRALCDHYVHVPAHDYLAVEDTHMVICHALARGLKESK